MTVAPWGEAGAQGKQQQCPSPLIVHVWVKRIPDEDSPYIKGSPTQGAHGGQQPVVDLLQGLAGKRVYLVFPPAAGRAA